MAPIASIRKSTRLKCVQEHVSRVNIHGYVHACKTDEEPDQHMRRLCQAIVYASTRLLAKAENTYEYSLSFDERAA